MSEIVGGPCPKCGQQGVFDCCDKLHPDVVNPTVTINPAVTWGGVLPGSSTDASAFSLLPKPQLSEPPTVSVPVSEWSLLNRRIGYLEGILEGLRGYPDDTEPMLVRAMQRYQKICGE